MSVKGDISPASVIDQSHNQANELNGESPAHTIMAAGINGSLSDIFNFNSPYHRSQELGRVLKRADCFDTWEESSKREEIIPELERILNEWVTEMSKGIRTRKTTGQICGRLLVYGSYGLGAHERESDIDACCVVPRNISRDSFFRSFLKHLKKQQDATDVRGVENAYVPVIKLKYRGIDVDLIVACLRVESVNTDVDLLGSDILRSLDPRCIRSLSGYRVVVSILKLIPEEHLQRYYRALHCTKLWAKKNGIYGAVFGYLGGITWAILMVYIVKSYPEAEPTTLVLKFFETYSQWNWPRALLVKNFEPNVLSLHVWNAQLNDNDAWDLMPILTPSYPECNSTHNVSIATRGIITAALKRGYQVWKDVLDGRCNMTKMFDPYPFFCCYKVYMVVMAKCKPGEDHLNWYGLVESRLIRLQGELEKEEQIAQSHIWPLAYDGVCPEYGDPQRTWFIGLKSSGPELHLSSVIDYFIKSVPQVARSFYKNGEMGLEVTLVKRRKLNTFLPPSVIEAGAPERDQLSTSSSTSG